MYNQAVRLLIFIAASLFSFSGFSQIIGTFGYGGNGTFEIASVIKNLDNEVFIVGSAFNETDEDILVIKHSPEGELLWSKFFGVNGNIETARSAVTDGEGGIFVIGQSTSASASNTWSGAYLIRINQQGEVVFSNRYTATTDGAVSEKGITMTRIDDALYLGGLAYQGINEDWSDYFIIQTGLNGSTNWSRSYGTSMLQSISTLSNGGSQSLISTGKMTSDHVGVDFAAGIGRYSLDGTPDWLRKLEYGSNFTPKTIMTAPNSYVVFGATGAENSGERNFILVRVDEDGETIWAKEILMAGDETPVDMKYINNKIVISGYADGFADQPNHIVVMSFDLIDGDLLWKKAINDSSDDYVYPERENLIIESTGELVQVGYTTFAGDGSGNSEIRVTHVGPNQENTCGEFEPTCQAVDINVLNNEIDLEPAFNFTNFVVGSYAQDTVLNSSLCVSEVNVIEPDSIDICFNAPDTIETVDLDFDNYLWSTNETTPEIVPDAEGWYWVDAEINGSVFTDSIFVSITTPTIDLGPDQFLCEGEEYEIVPQGNYNSLEWMSGENFDPSLSESGSYWVEAEIDSCFAQDSIEIEVIEEPEVDLGNALLLCSPADSILVNSELDPGYNFEWNNGGDEPQSYYSATGLHWLEVTIEDCTFDYEFEISLATQNLIDPTELTICDGSSVEVGLIDPEMDGSWNIGETGSEIEVEEAGTYVVEVSEQGCLLIDSVQVELIQSPEYGVEDQEVCPGTTYIVETPGFAGQVWVNGLETTESEVEVYAGNHQVQYIYYGCSFSVNFDVDYTKDTLDFDTHYAICDGDTLVLSVSDSLNPIWDGFAESSSFSITQGGNYELAFEMFECTFRETIEVKYEGTCPCSEPVFIPNSFTPNSDGNNEFFRPVIYCPLDEYHLMIFNRWGQKVFDSKDPEALWDGSNRGGDYFNQNDTFQYVLQYSKKSSTEVETVRGHVTVVR
ncbi:T9SS type B sorting domain-containing protein [Halocola ammonii]